MWNLPKRQRAWVGVCVAVTLPFFARDITQLQPGKTPPLLNASLAVFPLIPSQGIGEAGIGQAVSLRLEEVRAVVGDAHPAWKPYAPILPEVPPTGQFFYPDALDLRSLPPEETMNRFAVSWTGNADESIPTLIRTDSGTDGTKYATNWNHYTPPYGRWGTSAWQAFKKTTKTADVYAGIGFASDTCTLAQFPVPGSLGVSYGAKAVWKDKQEGYITPIEIVLPPNRRPRQTGTYCVTSYTIDRWGMRMLADVRTVELSPKTDSIHLPLPKFAKERDAQAVRVTITPYHWARFADVPLAIPGGNTAQLNPIAITPDGDQKRRAVVQGGGGAIGDYHEVVRVGRDKLTHPQLAQFVTGAITITHSRQYLDSSTTNISRRESYFSVSLPDSWDDVKKSVTLYAITPSGKRVRALNGGWSNENGGIRCDFQLSDVPYDNVAEVSFGLTR